MSLTHNLNFTWAENNAGTLNQGVAAVGQAEINLDFQLAASTTNQQMVAFAFTQAKLQSMFIYSDQTITLKTNSTGAPQDTITLTAGMPFVWYLGCGITVPFAGNVTTGYFTNAGSTAANIKIKGLVTEP